VCYSQLLQLVRPPPAPSPPPGGPARPIWSVVRHIATPVKPLYGLRHALCAKQRGRRPSAACTRMTALRRPPPLCPANVQAAWRGWSEHAPYLISTSQHWCCCAPPRCAAAATVLARRSAPAAQWKQGMRASARGPRGLLCSRHALLRQLHLYVWARSEGRLLSWRRARHRRPFPRAASSAAEALSRAGRCRRGSRGSAVGIVVGTASALLTIVCYEVATLLLAPK
jgi:hypothetical protein